MPKTAVLTADAKAAKRKAFRKHLKRYWVLYAMLVLPIAYYIVFKYVPMVGNVLAFRRYRPGKGPFGTEWTLRYFDRFLRDPMFWRALRNTLVLSMGNILINFPIPMVPPGVYFIRDLAVHGVDGHYLPGGHHLHQPGPV